MNEEVTSIHEAGHAVVSCFFDVPFTYVSIGYVWLDTDGEPTEGLIDPFRNPDGAGGVYFAPRQRLSARLEGTGWETSEGLQKVHEAVTIEAAILLAARVAVEKSGHMIQERHFSNDDAYVAKLFNYCSCNAGGTLQQFREKVLAGLRELIARPCIWRAVVETSNKLVLANWAEERVTYDTVNAIVEPCKEKGGA
jgi:hypothetical protein